MNKKLIAALLALVMIFALAACGSRTEAPGKTEESAEQTEAPAKDKDMEAPAEETEAPAEETEEPAENVTITLFHSMPEIQSQMEAMAERYSEAAGVDLEVYSSSNGAADLSARYAANDPCTISMVDAQDIYALAAEHAVDLSDQDWVKDTTQAIAIDGKVYGFPVCVEARGILYNADAISAITGEDFDPSGIKTTEDFQVLIDTLIAGGMETPTGLMEDDQSLGAHFLAEVYEQQEDPDAFIAGIKDGSVTLIDDPKFNALMDTFDVLKDNRYAKDSAISADREDTVQKLAEGEIAFLFGSSRDWPAVSAYDHTESMGIMPVPNDSEDGSNEKLVGGGSRFFFIDASDNTSDTQRQAAKDFLNWLVYEEDGQNFLVNECALVPAFSGIPLAAADPLGASVKSYADAGAMIGSYNYLPDDHYATVGASFQKYLADQIDRAGLADELTAYWATAEVIEH